MRAVIISSDGYLDNRIQRVLHNNDIKGDIVNKFTRSTLNTINCVIFTHKNDIPNLPVLIEQIVLDKKVLVIYISNSTSIGKFYNVFNNMYFSNVSEYSLDIELPLIIKNGLKYLSHIDFLENENYKLKDQLMTIKLTNKAKRFLITKGLSEEESHKFIQQKAMDMRISKKRLVNLIIENKIDI